MKCFIEESKDSIILKIEENRIDTQNAEEFGKILNELDLKGYKTVEIDLSEVKSMNTSGIGKLLFFNKKISKEGKTLKISAISEELKEVFKLLRIDKIFDIFDK